MANKTFVGPTVTPAANGEGVLQWLNNWTAKLIYKGSDGVNRSRSLKMSAQGVGVLPYLSGRYYVGEGIGLVTGSPTAPGADSVRLMPIYLRDRVTINSLGLRVTTAAAGGNAKVAIYAADQTTGLPSGAPLATSAALSTAAVAAVEDTTVSATLDPGWYWTAVLCDTSAATAVFTATGSTNENVASFAGGTAITQVTGTTGILTGLSKAQTYASGFPTLTGVYATDALAAITTVNCPIAVFRAA